MYLVPDRIFCIGALHFDLKIACEADWVSHAADSQIYSDLEFTLGGTGFNLARIVKNKGFSPRFFAVVGNDDLSRHSLSLARNIFGEQLIPLIADCSTRAVALIYARNDGVTYRKVVGPEWSAVDAIAPEALLDVASSLAPGDILFLDGYILRNQAEALEALARLLIEKEVRCALELVPHDIARFRNIDELRVIFSACSHISCNVGTIESLLGITPSTERIFRDRVEIVRETLPSLGNANWHLRGGKDGAEFSALVGADGVQYGYHDHGGDLVQSLGDSQFVDEVLAASCGGAAPGRR